MRHGTDAKATGKTQRYSIEHVADNIKGSRQHEGERKRQGSEGDGREGRWGESEIGWIYMKNISATKMHESATVIT